MAGTLADLRQDVAENTSATQAVITLVQGLAQRLRDAVAANDPAAIQALADELDANTAALSQAVTDNTTPDQPPAPGPDQPAPTPDQPAPADPNAPPV